VNIYATIKEIITDIVTNINPNIDENILKNISCEKPKNESYGDVSSNVVMLLRKKTNLSAYELSEIIIDEAKKNKIFNEINFVKPGFINFKLSISVWHELLFEIKKKEYAYGFKNLGKGEKINIEFVSANPTGPLHIGHARGAVIGDVLSNLLELNGYQVTKEYYINDRGGQINNLVRTIILHCKNLLDKSDIQLDNEMYKGEYLKKLSEKLIILDNFNLNKKEEIQTIVVEKILDDIKKDLTSLGINFDVFTSEKKLFEEGILDKAIDILEKKDFIYKGTLEKPKGKEIKEWSPLEQTLFKATKLGDSLDRPIKKNNGEWTYFASDIGYHYDKCKRGFNELINIWGADHAGYIKRVEAALKALDNNKVKFNVILCQIVNLIDKNKIIKMSKRKGNVVLIKDVINAIGKDVLRFYMLTRKSDAHIDFDLSQCIKENRENPIFYVQYAIARVNSISQAIDDLNIDIESYDNMNTIRQLSLDEEIIIIKALSLWPKVIESSVLAREPHRIVYYVIELAAKLHAFWTMGKSKNSYRIINKKNVSLTIARYTLLNCVKLVLINGLKILSIEPVDKM
tara:strand:+ start:3489 stop:5204 length:1716 start_codon:yes stop_codon:yes gene_type:complete